jgi:hypothetical protein
MFIDESKTSLDALYVRFDSVISIIDWRYNRWLFCFIDKIHIRFGRVHYANEKIRCRGDARND